MKAKPVDYIFVVVWAFVGIQFAITGNTSAAICCIVILVFSWAIDKQKDTVAMLMSHIGNQRKYINDLEHLIIYKETP